MKTKFSIGVFLPVLGLLAYDVLAQDSLVLEEITVTAQKREQSLKDVPISVSAIGGDYIQDASIDSLADLSGSVPNLSISEGQIDTTIAIRGIQTGANKGFEQSVAMYMDGVYFGRSQLFRLPLVDLERIEVLRGPQPTLFGKNAIAGAVSVTTARPTDEFEGSVSVSHEFEHDELQGVAVLSGPLTDNVSGRLVVSYRDLEGYVTNTTFNRKEPNTEQSYVRGLLNWDNDDNARVLFKAEYSDFNTHGRPLENHTPLGAFEALYPIIWGETIDVAEDYRNEGRSYHSTNEVTNLLVNAEFDIGDLTLTSVTGYVDYDTVEDIDVDYTALILLDGTNQTESYSQFSQEFRLTSPAGEKVDYIVGAYFQSNELDVTDQAFIGSAILSLPAPFSLLNDSWYDRFYNQEGTLWSIFAHADINFTDRVTLTVGARYNDEDKDGSRSVELMGGPANVAIGLPSPVPVFDNLLEVLWSTFNVVNHSAVGNRGEDALNPLVNLQVQFTDTFMGYVSYAEGTKAGGFDIRGNSLPTETRVARAGSFEFEDESATAIELGAKMRWDRFDLNVALYSTNYEDLQTSIFDGGLSFIVLNASEVTTQGIEADWRALLIENLQMYGAIGYLDFEYDSFVNGACAFGEAPTDPVLNQCDRTGDRGPFAPEWTGNLGFDWESDISSNLVLDANLHVDFTSSTELMASLDDFAEQSGYEKVRLQVGIGDLDGKWRVSLIGNNLTDERVRIASGNVPLQGTILGLLGTSGNAYDSYYARPRNVTLKFDYNF